MYERKKYFKSFKNFRQFASPTGFGYMFSKRIGVTRRLLWCLFIIFGLGYSLHNISESWKFYKTYPTTIKPAFTTEDKLKFPKSWYAFKTNVLTSKFLVTLCPNGVHSKQLVEKHYPAMADVDLAGIYASGYMKSKDIEVLKSIDFDSFLNKTALPFGLLGCRKRFI